MIFIPRIILQSILWLLINVTFNGSTGVIGYADSEYIVNIMCYKFCCCLRINGKVISELSEKRGFNRDIRGRAWLERRIYRDEKNYENYENPDEKNQFDRVNENIKLD